MTVTFLSSTKCPAQLEFLSYDFDVNIIQQIVASSVSNMALFGKIERVMTDADDIQRQMADAGSESDISDSDSDSDEEKGPARKKQRKSTNENESLKGKAYESNLNNSAILISDDDNSSEDETSFNISNVEVQDIEISEDVDEENDEFLLKLKAGKKKKKQTVKDSDAIDLIDDSDGEDEIYGNDGNLDANALLERRRREAYGNDNEDEDDDIFKTIQKKEERQKKSMFTFSIALNSKKELKVPYSKSASLCNLKSTVLEKLSDFPSEFNKFRSMRLKFEGENISESMTCDDWLDDNDLCDVQEVQIEFGS